MDLIIIFLIVVLFNGVKNASSFRPMLSHSSVLSKRTLSPLCMGISVEEVISKVKVVKFGATSSNPDLSVEVSDRKCRECTESIVTSRVGGIGLDLAEYQVSEDGFSGIVVVNGINPDSNAEAAQGFKVGDILVSITGVDGIEGTETYNNLAAGEKPLRAKLEGLNLDKTLDMMSYFGEYASVKIQVKRLVQRNVIKVKVKGPQGEDAGEMDVLSGYGVNLRTILNSTNRKIYDTRTYRFDSPYQQGNCGGEGTCGTCMVAVLSGEELLNDKARVERKALLAQNAPPNYRWSCRVAIGGEAEEEMEGEVVIKLRPQTTQWDGVQ